MLIDTPQVVEGSAIINPTVASGAAFPLSASAGELFYLTTGTPGLYAHNGTSWDIVAKGADLVTHIADGTKHLTTAQNTLIDAVTVTAAHKSSSTRR